MAASTQVPPQNLRAEESLLGALMVTGKAWAEVHKCGLPPEPFYFQKHNLIWAAIVDLATRAAPSDEISVVDALRKRGKLDEAGGADYVAELAAKVPAAGNARHYAEIVDRAARLRRVITNAQLASEAAYEGTLNGEAAGFAEALRELAASGPGLQVRPADLSRARPVRFAWEGRLPIGYLSLLLGAEGVGKGTLIAHLLARATTGELPGDLWGQPVRVLLVGDEDSFDSVVVPRLYAAGADLDLVDTLSEADDSDLLDVRRDAARLRDLVVENGYRIVFLDALLDTLGVDVDDWRSKAVRDALRPLRRAARDADVALLGALHPNKGQRTSYRDLVSGSHAFNASSRSSLLLAEHPEDESRRILVRGKGNLSAAPPAFDFAIEGRELEINGHAFSLPVVTDTRETDLGIADVIKPQREAPVRESLADEINALGTGEIQRRSEIAQALGRDPADGSVGRALDQLEDQGRWQKIGRGKWQRIAFASSNELAKGKSAEVEGMF